MTAIIVVGNHEFQASSLMEEGAFRATVLVRVRSPRNHVRSVGYVFDEAFETNAAAVEAAVMLARRISISPELQTITADEKLH